jgi:hypothetical protein
MRSPFHGSELHVHAIHQTVASAAHNDVDRQLGSFSAAEKGDAPRPQNMSRMRQACGCADRRKGLALPVSRPVPCVRLDDRAVKLDAVAVKLWNEAKRESKARARSK